MSKTPDDKAQVKGPVKSTFYALADGCVAGLRVKAGDPVELTEAQAKYEPVSSEKPAAAKPASKAAKGDGAK